MIKTLFSFLLFAVLSWGIFQLNDDFTLWWNANSVHISGEAPLSPDKLKLEMGISLTSLGDSLPLKSFMEAEGSILLFDGELKEAVPNEYGENDYLIRYADSLYLLFRHYKKNRRHQHRYYFHFYPKDQKVWAQVEIRGQDPMQFTYALQPIAASHIPHKELPPSH